MKYDDIKDMIIEYAGFHDCIVEKILIENSKKQIELQFEDLNQCLCNASATILAARLIFKEVTDFYLSVFSSGLIAIYGMEFFVDSQGIRFEIEWSTDKFKIRYGKPYEKWVIVCKDVKLDMV